MTPAVPLLAGLALIALAWLLLRSFGPRLRVGRLLAATPRATIAEALAIAAAGDVRYVRVDGRIDSAEPFEDENHRPLVLRRTRLQSRGPRGWRTFEENREQVPFEIHEGLDAIGVDAAALDEGLVVVPRESTGTAADVVERAGTLDPATPVRLRIEHVSAVEHATVLGVPVATARGVVMMAGLGRPLVLTTLEPREAMRVIAEGRTTVPRYAAAALVAGLALSGVGLAWAIVQAIA